MNIERINVNSIKDIESARVVIGQLVECIFEMRRENQRILSNLTSQNVRTLDFNVTEVRNIDSALKKSKILNE